MRAFALMALLCVLSLPASAQRIEKLDLVMAPPTVNTDRGNGYGFEMRGDVFARGTSLPEPRLSVALDGKVSAVCDQPAGEKLGRYVLKVRYAGENQELIATWAITLGARTVAWESYSRYEIGDDGDPLSWVYEGQVLRAKTQVISDFTAASPNCFGGRLTLFFIE
ncbi:MAG TPA: hypothetical protein PLD20_26875 [Blastocatellia bacterium]|nr:hypothetical protein [Blastocatellia bacterium]HMX29853.1 hypothetical protein [Blastocatellia bacterium]HMY74191.1 hypothetical protein [Blastocatellia bacterium]HMZ21587.1 hypothetical protein [Blastocatellia bacterium]